MSPAEYRTEANRLVELARTTYDSVRRVGYLELAQSYLIRAAQVEAVLRHHQNKR